MCINDEQHVLLHTASVLGVSTNDLLDSHERGWKEIWNRFSIEVTGNVELVRLYYIEVFIPQCFKYYFYSSQELYMEAYFIWSIRCLH